MVAKACVHRYELDQPVARQVHGRCRLCGHERSWPQYPQSKERRRGFRIKHRAVDDVGDEQGDAG